MNTWTQHTGEGMGQPTVYAIALPEGAGGGVGRRWPIQTDMDERRFEAAWFADFRERWRRDLYAQRIAFAARLAALMEAK